MRFAICMPTRIAILILSCLYPLLQGCNIIGTQRPDIVPELAEWLPTEQLTSSSDASRLQFNWGWAIAVDGVGTIHQAWLEIFSEPDPNEPAGVCGQVYYRGSVDDGKLWSPPVPLNEPKCVTGHPKIAAHGNHVYVVWHQLLSDNTILGIQLVHSGDRGLNWDPAIIVSDNPPGISTAWPSVNAWGDSVHVVWGDSRSGSAEIHLRSSTDGGRTWNPVQMVSKPDGISSWTPSIASWGAVVHVVWTDERHNTDAAGEPFDCASVGAGESCREEEYYRRSLDFGLTWEEEIRLTVDPAEALASSWAPSIAVWENDVHVAFFDRRTGEFEIYYKRSREGGSAGSWEDAVRLSEDVSIQHARPSIAVNDKDVHIVYWGQSPHSSNIYYLSSPDGGDHFQPPILLSSTGPSEVPHPSVAVSTGGSVHVLWYAKDMLGLDQIFYRRKP
ncbi:MAG: hypothetical protein GTO14_22935 [Anaerolineales bacterium]|nr:hypothetical protein [Anaerolineales bacterium]